MIEIAVRGGKKYYGAVTILDNINFEVHNGQKIGIVGRNGSGKSTLFRILAQMEPMDEGSITIRKGATLGYQEQIPKYPQDFTADHVLNTAFEDISNLQKQLDLMEHTMATATGLELERLLTSYAEVQECFSRLGGYTVDSEKARISQGLKIEHLLDKTFTDLSGGEKSRVALGTVLLRKPDILLLDEPTNHLDFSSLTWLEEFILSYPGTVLVITHDRYFLDNVVDGILALNQQTTEYYPGNYSNYVLERQKNIEAMGQAYAIQQKKISEMERTIKTLRDWGTRADNEKFFRRAASLQKRLDKTERVERPPMEKELALAFTSNARSGKEVVIVSALSKRFGERLLLQGVECTIRYGEQVAILGPNGCGKSTFLRILLGEITADEGQITLGSGVRLGVLMQETTFPNEEATVLDHFRLSIPSTEIEARRHLAKYLFFGDDVFRPIRVLSGGERKRLALAVMVREDLNLLILDEPTNHLDIDAREALEEALENFGGTLVFASHDRYFINRLADRVLSFSNLRLKNILGNYDDYLIEAEKEASTPRIEPKTEKPKKSQPQSFCKISDEKYRRRLEEIEAELLTTEATIKQLEEEMVQHGTDYNRVDSLFQEISQAKSVWDSLWKEYEVLMEPDEK